MGKVCPQCHDGFEGETICPYCDEPLEPSYDDYLDLQAQLVRVQSDNEDLKSLRDELFDRLAAANARVKELAVWGKLACEMFSGPFYKSGWFGRLSRLMKDARTLGLVEE